jgi:hypothetical protein
MSQINHSSRSYLAKSSDFKSFKSEKKNSLKARHNCRKRKMQQKKKNGSPDVAKRTGCPATLLFQSKRLLDI